MEVPPPDQDPRDCALLFDTFLAVPLVSVADGYTEHKFSGGLQVGHNDHSLIGRVVDAFAHHVLLDSERTCVFADLQGTLSFCLFL